MHGLAELEIGGRDGGIAAVVPPRRRAPARARLLKGNACPGWPEGGGLWASEMAAQLAQGSAGETHGSRRGPGGGGMDEAGEGANP